MWRACSVRFRQDPFDKTKRHLRKGFQNPEGPELVRPTPTVGMALSADFRTATATLNSDVSVPYVPVVVPPRLPARPSELQVPSAEAVPEVHATPVPASASDASSPIQDAQSLMALSAGPK